MPYGCFFNRPKMLALQFASRMIIRFRLLFPLEWRPYSAADFLRAFGKSAGNALGLSNSHLMITLGLLVIGIELERLLEYLGSVGEKGFLIIKRAEGNIRLRGITAQGDSCLKLIGCPAYLPLLVIKPKEYKEYPQQLQVQIRNNEIFL